MRIGIIIGRIGGVDGVALETEKWIKVLRRMGHQIFVITGNLETDLPHCTIVPEMDFHHPDTIREQNDAFFRQQVDETCLLKRIHERAGLISDAVTNWIDINRIGLIISQNASSLPCHLAMGVAIKEVLESRNIRGIAHDHDFCWERGERYQSKFSGITDIVDEVFPTILPNLEHVVINSAAEKELKERYSLTAVNIPNVMNFDENWGDKAGYKTSLRESLGFTRDDILLFQVTRIVRRKGIETAIQLVKDLDDSRIHLIITGNAKDDENQKYLNELINMTKSQGLARQVHFFGDRFFRNRMASDSAHKTYQIEDAYAAADACTYFSSYEGFGNAFVEAVVSKTPVFVNNYKPVYWPDIGSLGFKTVMIENEALTGNSVNEIRAILTDPVLSKEHADFNYQLGKKYFSFDVLEQKLTGFFR